MDSHKRKAESLRAWCAQLHPDDGINPQEDKRADITRNIKPDRKTRQLCKQVAHALELALSGLPQADELVGASVQEVVPAPTAERFCVVVAVPGAERLNVVAAILERYARRLRQDVAGSINRRRAPELSFQVVPEGGCDG